MIPEIETFEEAEKRSFGCYTSIWYKDEKEHECFNYIGCFYLNGRRQTEQVNHHSPHTGKIIAKFKFKSWKH